MFGAFVLLLYVCLLDLVFNCDADVPRVVMHVVTLANCFVFVGFW